jgi:hypothetical protein
LAGGGHPGKRVEVVDVLVEVVVSGMLDEVELVEVVVAPGSVVVVGTTGGVQGLTVAHSSPTPGIDAAPGPGRFPAASTVGSKVGGTPKTLTSVAGTAPPRIPASGDPMVVMVLTVPPLGPKAPLSRCWHVSNGCTHAGPTAMPFSQHFWAGWANASEPSASRQKPENTRFWPPMLPSSFVGFVPVHDTTPVESAKPMGRFPRLSMGSGGQSWLVG